MSFRALVLYHLQYRIGTTANRCERRPPAVLSVVRASIYRLFSSAAALDVGLSLVGVCSFHAYGDWVLGSTVCEVVEIAASTDGIGESVFTLISGSG